MIFCKFVFFHVLFMFQKEELQEIIVNAISTARGRGGRGEEEEVEEEEHCDEAGVERGYIQIYTTIIISNIIVY